MQPKTQTTANNMAYIQWLMLHTKSDLCTGMRLADKKTTLQHYRVSCSKIKGYIESVDDLMTFSLKWHRKSVYFDMITDKIFIIGTNWSFRETFEWVKKKS